MQDDLASLLTVSAVRPFVRHLVRTGRNARTGSGLHAARVTLLCAVTHPSQHVCAALSTCAGLTVYMSSSCSPLAWRRW